LLACRAARGRGGEEQHREEARRHGWEARYGVAGGPARVVGLFGAQR
jgi:hypothetical protein